MYRYEVSVKMRQKQMAAMFNVEQQTISDRVKILVRWQPFSYFFTLHFKTVGIYTQY